MIFVNSMSDLFHKDVPDVFIYQVFETMSKAQHHIFQVLTKRPSRAVLMAHDLKWTSNIWLGTSIERNDYVWRADKLRQVSAAVRFISAEPLLGPLDHLNLEGIDWLIAGGESGSGHRSCNPEWVRSLRDRCVEQGVAFFFKQWGGFRPKSGGRELDGRMWDELPSQRILIPV